LILLIVAFGGVILWAIIFYLTTVLFFVLAFMAEGMTPNFNAFNWAPIWKSFNFTPMFFEIPSANFLGPG
jgi:hypothetical protein